jgi:FlaA1/EpsC-like NDP-sugar epimerase
MGKSMKIFDIAKKMIHLSGYKYPEDIDIEIIGLRPGGKLFEELLAFGENMILTYHENIMIAKTEELRIHNTLLLVDILCDTNKKIDNKNSVRIIKEIVPEYISNNSVYEKLDTTILS